MQPGYDGIDHDGTPLLEDPRNKWYYAKQVRPALIGVASFFIVAAAAMVAGKSLLPPTAAEFNARNSSMGPNAVPCALLKQPSPSAIVRRYAAQLGIGPSIPVSRAQRNQIATRCG